jgi:phage gpG-like protein
LAWIFLAQYEATDMSTAKADNFIKCRLCDWTTRRWGRGSNPGKAFRRLAEHMTEEHDNYALIEALNEEYTGAE